MLEADCQWPVPRRVFLDAEGRPRSVPVTANRVETAQEMSVSRWYGVRLTRWSFRTVFGRAVLCSMVLRTVGDQGLSSGGAFVRRLPVQDVDELRTRVLEKLGASNSGRQAELCSTADSSRQIRTDAPDWASAIHFSGPLFTWCPWRSDASRLTREEAGLENSRARSKTHAAGASAGVGAAAAAALVGGLPGGAVGRGDDGKGNGKKGGRG